MNPKKHDLSITKDRRHNIGIGVEQKGVNGRQKPNGRMHKMTVLINTK